MQRNDGIVMINRQRSRQAVDVTSHAQALPNGPAALRQSHQAVGWKPELRPDVSEGSSRPV